MAILQSCCYWKTVREGSYASAIYTLVYFGFSTIVLLNYVSEEREFLSGKRQWPVGESLLEKGDITPTTVIFNILFLVCSLLVVLSSLLVLLALLQDKRTLLLPWIAFMLGDISIEIAHLIYLGIAKRVIFDPIVGFVFTMDFFVTCLNCYCLACVISQYQEYRLGRGQRATPAMIALNDASPMNKTNNDETKQHHHHHHHDTKRQHRTQRHHRHSPKCFKSFP